MSYTYRSEVSERVAAYCNRCRRGFKTERGLQLHLQDSRHHWECTTCVYDADSWDSLLDHCCATSCRSVCYGCDDGQGEHWPYDSDEFWQHFEDENACTECDEHFDTRYALEQHDCPEYSGADMNEDEGYDTSYSEADEDGIETYSSKGDEADSGDSEESDAEACLKCDRNSTTYSGMILHLESGSCSDLDEIRLNMLATRCRKSREFVVEGSWYNMYCGCDMDGWDLYFCPICLCEFSKLSGLFQHIESPACEQELDEGVIGTLQRYLGACVDP